MKTLSLQNLTSCKCFHSGITDPSTVHTDTTLAELGLDSLMGVEVKQTLERDYDLSLSMKEIRHLTVTKLHDIAGGDGHKHSGEKLGDSSRVEEEVITRKLVATEALVKLNKCEGDPTIYFVHPIEG